MTPHNVHVEGHFAVVDRGRAWGSTRPTARSRADLVAAIRAAGLPVVGVSYGGNDPAEAELPLDWGTEVPLRFVHAAAGRRRRAGARPPARRARPARRGDRARRPAARRVALSRAPTTAHAHDAGRAVRLRPGRGGLRRALPRAARPRAARLPAARGARRGREGRLALAAPRAPGRRLRGRAELLAYAAPTYYGMAVGRIALLAPHRKEERGPRRAKEARHAAPEAQEQAAPRRRRAASRSGRSKAAGRAACTIPSSGGSASSRSASFSAASSTPAGTAATSAAALADGLDALIGGASWVVPVAFVALGGLMVARSALVDVRPFRAGLVVVVVRPDGRRSAATRAATSARSLGGAVGVAIGATGSTILGVLLLARRRAAPLRRLARRDPPPLAATSCAAHVARAPPPRRAARRSRPGTSRSRCRPCTPKKPLVDAEAAYPDVVEPRAVSRRRRS